MNVLIVDDSVAMRMMIIKTLRQAGLNNHTFSQAPDGLAALESIRKAQPDVVLCDWNMPNMTGIEMAVAVRQHDHLTKVRLMMVTTETESEHMAQAVAAGVNAYVMKPFTKDVIVGKLRELGL